MIQDQFAGRSHPPRVRLKVAPFFLINNPVSWKRANDSAEKYSRKRKISINKTSLAAHAASAAHVVPDTHAILADHVDLEYFSIDQPIESCIHINDCYLLRSDDDLIADSRSNEGALVPDTLVDVHVVNDIIPMEWKLFGLLCTLQWSCRR